MKQHSVLRRWSVMAGLCLLLVLILAASLGWTTIPSSRPAAQPAAARQPSAGGESAAAIADAAPAARPSRFPGQPEVVPTLGWPTTSKVAAEQAVRRAWERARDAAVYGFATDLLQTTYPALSLANAGRGPRQDAMRLEGQIDMPARTMRMSMREGGAAAAASRNGGEARIEGDRAYIRHLGGADSDWQEVNDFSVSFAPDSDLLAYLSGMTNVREVPAEERRSGGAGEQAGHAARSTQHVSRFAFDLDGRAFASYMTDQLQRRLSDSGELPAGLTLDSARPFRDVSGDGEIWIDGRGLPLRLTVHLVYPKERNGSHVEADITTDFSGFPEQIASAPNFTDNPIAWANGLFSQSGFDEMPEAGGTGGAIACGLGATALLLACRRSRRLYAAIVIAVIFSMVVVPLMQSERAAAFFERQTSRQAELDKSQQEQLAAQEAREEQRRSSWDPHRDPLAREMDPVLAVPDPLLPAGEQRDRLSVASAAGPQVTATPTPPPDSDCDPSKTDDPDGDGLTTFQECLADTFSTDADSDDDGLSDGQEITRLGTLPRDVDTDGDAIPDSLEVQGFDYGGQHWYLDSHNADTNSDGLVDSVECPPLVEEVTDQARLAAECDADGDGIPNPFDPDNDSDGVTDRVDLSPEQVADRAGVHSNGGAVTSANVFDGDHPFNLLIQGLQADWPVFVDMQLRPENPVHLSYSQNVLNWPSDDLDGQIQHVKETSFKDSDNPAIANPTDEPGGHGDMRLLPLLEIEMSGASIPLKQMAPAVTDTIKSGASDFATIKLTQSQAVPPGSTPDTLLAFEFQDQGTYDVRIHTGSCAALDTLVKTFTGVGDGSTQTYADQLLAGLADGDHAIVVGDSTSYHCGDIPRVVPVPQHDDKIVDTSVLDPYGISVHQVSESTLGAYVPLNLVADDTGGGKAAFSARMLYWPGAANPWGLAQPMRVVWAVEALTDSCGDEEDFPLTDKDREEDPENYDKQYDLWCEAHRTQDQIQIVQTYPESWHITGLAVREDHGLDVAIAYPNPANATYDDDSLWELSWGLGQSFVPERDCETDATIHTDPNPETCHVDGYRDLTVYETDSENVRIGNETISYVFDATRPAPDPVTETERWSIPVGALRVENHRYATQDHLSYMAMTQAPRILEQFRQKYGTGVHPTLLYAREEHYRSFGLEAATGTAGGALTLAGGVNVYQQRTLAGMSWAPYRYNPAPGPDGQVIGWEAYPIAEYWDTLTADLQARFLALYPSDLADTRDGRVIVARAYYIALVNGIESEVPESGCPVGEESCPYPSESQSYEDIVKSSERLSSRLSHVTTEIGADIWEMRHKLGRLPDLNENGEMQWIRCPKPGDNTCSSLFQSLKESASEFFVSPWKAMFSNSSGLRFKVAGALLVAAAVSAVAITIFALAKGGSWNEILADIFYCLNVVVATFATARAVADFMKYFAGATLKEVAHFIFHDFSFRLRENAAGALALLLHVIVTWAAWVVEFKVGHLTPGSMAFDNSLATTIAATITAVVMFLFLACLGPIGKLIGAIIALVDALAGLLCNAFLSEEQKETNWAQWVCGGITGIVTNWYKRLIYSGTLIPDLDPDEDKGPPWYPRLDLAGYRSDLVDQAAGIVVGNAFKPRITLINTIDLEKTPIAWQEVWAGDQFSKANLETSSFDYRWQTEEKDFHDGLARDGMPPPGWQETEGGLPLQYTTDVVGTEPIPLTTAGINQPVDMYLSEAYALPEQQCWGYIVYKKCTIETEKGTVHYPIGEELKFDVLPATLDGFYTLARQGSGYRQAWDPSFPVLYDADGDGLPATSDPNDSLWDTDGDGLSDYFEVMTGSSPTLPETVQNSLAGTQATQPTAADSDHDGLDDLQEAQIGTSPSEADTDGDGLYDCQEVFHQVLAEDHLGGTPGAVCGRAGNWSGGWTVVYGTVNATPFATRETSDPTSVDTDGDGLTDAQERTYGYNPRAYSVLDVLNLKSTLSEIGQGGTKTPSDGFVAPGQTLYYSATVKNALDNRVAQGLLSSQASSVFNNQGVAPQSFILGPQDQVNISGNIAVAAGASTGVYSLTQVAGALITDPSVESDDAALWLRFDEPSGATVFTDSSGQVPAHSGRCGTAGGCALEPTGGKTGGALKLTGTDWVEVPLDVSETAYAMALWFKTTCTDCGIFSVDAGALGAGGHDRHVYLNAGNVCTRVYNNEIKCTSGASYADGQWHQVVHTYGGSVGGQKIYVDGVLMASGAKAASNFTWQDGINIGFSNDAAQHYFSGSIDDVRVFKRALTQAEVDDLISQLLLHLDFDAPDAWRDTSNFHAPIADCGTHCPSHTTTAIAGRAAGFNGSQYLNVPAAAQLDLTGGQFTMAAWIRPEARGGTATTEGILGLNSGEASAYPSIQRVGRKIQFSFGTGSQWLTPYVSGDVLTEGQWTHVAIAYDKADAGGTLRLYINGTLIQTKPFAAPALAPTRSIDIGRSSKTANLSIQDFHEIQPFNKPQTCDGVPPTRMCMAINSTEVLNRDFNCYEGYTMNVDWAVTEPATLKLWKDAVDPKCGSAPNSGDSVCTLSWTAPTGVMVAGTSKLFTTNDLSAGAITEHRFSNCGSGYFNLSFTNYANPFYGELDEVVIYNQVLTDDAVKTLFVDTVTALRMPLDEAPGMHLFADTSLARRQAWCSDPACPTSGVDGRMDRAVWLDGLDDSLRLGSFGDFANTTVSAWVYRTKAATARQTVVSYKEDIGCGFVLAVENNVPKFWVNVEGTWRGPAIGSTQLAVNQWAHLAGSYDGSILTLYVNGAPAGTASYAGSIKNGTECAAGLTSIGSRNDNKQHWFPGLIDDVWISSRSLPQDRIAQIYALAPVLHLRFDEAHGANQFADVAQVGRFGSCTAPDCPLTGEAVEGQIGLAAEFDGLDDRVVVADSAALRPASFSVGAWAMPITSSQNLQLDPWHELVGKWNVPAKAAVNYRLFLHDDLAPGLEWGCGAVDVNLTAVTPLILNHWNHVMGTFDGTALKIYVNGVEHGSKPVPAGSTCTSDAPIEIGGHTGMSPLEFFTGRLDEVVVYNRALSAGQVRDLYDYQSGWVEDRQSRDLTVDHDAPSATLLIAESAPYWPNQPVIVTIDAQDETSSVATVTLSGQQGSTTRTWNAAVCADSGGTASWCASFQPWGEQVYTLRADATDVVGNAGSSSARSVRIDDTAPTLTLDAANMQLFNATASQTQANHWVVSLAGTVQDPALLGGTAGSGIPSDGVTVTLRLPDGTVLGKGAQVATISGNTWSVQYDFLEGQPAGCYDVEVAAVDNVARIANLDAAQVVHHTRTVRERISLDADAAGVGLDWANVAGGQIGPTTTTLRGETSDRPVPVEVDWTTDADGALASLTVACQDGSGSWVTAYTAPAGSFEPNKSYTWSVKNQIQQGSACKVILAAPGPTGVAGGQVKVCGSQVASWTGEPEVAFAATSGSCGDACGISVKVAGVKGVDVAYASLLPGSAFLNQTPPEGELIHLPLDDVLNADGATLPVRDVSGVGQSSTCNGITCPSPGQAGRVGSAMLFDGLDDAVYSTYVPGYDTTDHLSISAWIKPTGAPYSSGEFIARKSRYLLSRTADGTIRWAFANVNGFSWHATPYKAPLNEWTHIAVVYDNGTVVTYANGAPVDSYAGSVSGSVTNNSWLEVGGYASYGQFAGLMDEVRLFNRALAGDEIKALYTGSDPLLMLPFEDLFLTDGDRFADASVWGRDATLHTGTADVANKAVAGQVGDYALQLDGIDDYAVVPDDDAIDFDTNHDFAVTAWIKPAPAQVWTATVDNNVIEKWSGAGGYPYSIRYLNQTAGANAGKISAGRWDGTNGPWLQSTTRIDDGRFHHVAFVKNGGTLAFYVDGVQQGQRTDSTTGATANSSPLYIGRRGGAALQGYFTGSMDDVRIYPRALSAPEIQGLFLGGWQAATLAQTGAAVESSSWTALVPSGLEGSYRLEMRGSDAAGHRASVRERAALWTGEADTLNPRVTLSRSAVDANTYRYTTTAEDYHLAETSFTSPCGDGVISTREYFRAPWYLGSSGDGQMLYRLIADCQVTAGTVTEQATACDSFGNCTTANATIASSAAAEREGDTEIVTPSPPHPLTPSLSQAGEVELGPEDEALPPRYEIVFANQVLTSTHYSEPGTVAVSGYVTASGAVPDRRRLASVQVSIGGVTGEAILSETQETSPYIAAWRFLWRLPSGDLPDGAGYTAVVTVTDRLGRTTSASAPLAVDVVPPAPVALTLSSAGSPLAPGDVLRSASPELVLTWTPSSDGGGLAGYATTWTAQSAETTAVTSRAHDASGTLEDRFTGGEAQAITVHLASQDRLGNVRSQSFGPVYADTPRTPDYIAFPPAAAGGITGEAYSGWLDSGCSLLGADRRLEAISLRYGVRRPPQRLHATWDSQALRLAWNGANWSSDGDLFIYLDTSPGGTSSTFTPHQGTGGSGVALDAPDSDRVIWVQDSSMASLLAWDGTSWITDTLLTDAEYRFSPSLRDGQTDLYLPFDLLGMNPASQIGVLAFAAEDHAPGTSLQVWATVPRFNSVNSKKVNPLYVLAPEGMGFTLKHPYVWQGLSDDVCPNGSLEAAAAASTGDADLQISVTSDPPGVALAGVISGLYWVPNPEVARSRLTDLHLVGQPPLDDGQEILYTVRYKNAGSNAAKDVQLKLRALGQLHLPDESVTLGENIPAGAEGSVTFRAVVDQGGSQVPLAMVAGGLYDAAHGPGGAPIEWLWTAHRVDQGEPDQDGFSIDSLGSLVGPERTRLLGHALDESGISTVKLEVTAPSGRISVLDCPVGRPAEGSWSCDLDATASNGGGRPADGGTFSLRLQAADRFGHTSRWVGPWTVRVDALPPTVTVNMTATSVLPGGLIRGDSLALSGDAADPAGVGAVEVCMKGGCEAADLYGQDAGAQRWSYRTPHAGPLDFVTHTLTIEAIDRAGNRTSDAQQLEVTFDNVAPVLTVIQAETQAALGSRLTVLRGTATDGGPSAEVSVRVQSPGGDVSRMSAARAGDTWSFDLPADLQGQYTLWVDAEDLAGNVATVGPFTVDVTCTDAAPVITSLTAEPVAGPAVSLTLTAVMSNTGRDPLPARIPVGFSDETGPIGQVTTTARLGPGESQALSIAWAPDSAREYNIDVIVGQNGILPYGLCATPPQAHFSIQVQDLPLFMAWNLISPPVEPNNTDVQVVQRPVEGAYTAILGYDGGPKAYYPDRPQESSLTTVDALHGYWIKTIAPPGVPSEELQGDEQVASWRMVGRILPEDRPLLLASGWNLAGYLPRRPLTVTTALQGIAGQYASVLGFDYTALSYYPDLDPSYNTLYYMAPGYGYWISATRAITLHYPRTGITQTVSLTDTARAWDRLFPVLKSESDSGVQPTYEWMNFYGKLALPDGTGAPAGTVVLAIDAQGVICGATATWQAGQYGLLACYGDDPDTPVDEGGVPGDAIRLVVGEGSPPAPGSWVVGEGTWTAHGARQQVPAGPPIETPYKAYLPLLLREEAAGDVAPAPGLDEPGPTPGSESD